MWDLNLLRTGLERVTHLKTLWRPCYDQIKKTGCPVSAVLILLQPRKQEHHQRSNPGIDVLLTRRADSLHGRGMLVLPGGKRQSEDAYLFDTALREAEEEIGLERSLVSVIGHLVPCIVPDKQYGYGIVTAVVGYVDRGIDIDQLCPNPHEVEDMFWVPLERFTESKGHHQVTGLYNDVKNVTIHFFRFHLDDEMDYVWGYSALSLMVLSVLMYQRQPPFPIWRNRFCTVDNVVDMTVDILNDVRDSAMFFKSSKTSKL